MRHILMLISMACIGCGGSRLNETGTSGGSSGGTGATGGGAPLVFAVVGDTRPSQPCKSITSCGYPTSTITQIYKDLTEISPAPQLIVGTGDYMYNDPDAGTAAWQVQQYLSAATQVSVPIFLTMGNHECTGATASECGSDNPNGLTENYGNFLNNLLPALKVQTSTPYYVETVPAGPGQTAKFVFVASNAWDDGQATWLSQTLAQPTTYTFVIRHVPTSDARDCPGVTPSDQIIDANPLTLKIVGHSHVYSPWTSQEPEVIVGNGGAPLDNSSQSFGFVLCQQRSDGAIQCSDYDSQSNTPTGQAFALTANGQSTALD